MENAVPVSRMAPSHHIPQMNSFSIRQRNVIRYCHEAFHFALVGFDHCGRGHGHNASRHGEPPILGIGAFALFLALINASIKPIVHTIALPFSILSFGLIALIINWLFMELASWLAISMFDIGVTIDGFWWSVIGSLIMAIVSGLVGTVIRD